MQIPHNATYVQPIQKTPKDHQPALAILKNLLPYTVAGIDLTTQKLKSLRWQCDTLFHTEQDQRSTRLLSEKQSSVV
jgi:hypothetical protein